jgi:hypothetical protein
MDRDKDIIRMQCMRRPLDNGSSVKKRGEVNKKRKRKQKKGRKGEGGNQKLERVEFDIKKGWTPETGGEVGVTNISDKKVRLRQERT